MMTIMVRELMATDYVNDRRPVVRTWPHDVHHEAMSGRTARDLYEVPGCSAAAYDPAMARNSRWLLGSAGAVALLAMDGCATPGGPVTTARLHWVRTLVEPPPISPAVASTAAVTPAAGVASAAGTARATGTTAPAATPPPPVSPFLDAPVSFLIRGHFTRGELVIVRVCLRLDHSIASSDVIESSGDRLFDQMALTWAQRVRQRESAPAGRPVASCGAVRVELHDATQPSVIGDPADQLG
jgi:hypothetical protein